MLFDLRAPGRKRAIQAVYIVLAVVLVGGTILFGVGTGLPGIFGGNDTASNESLGDQNRDRLESLQKRVDANPRDAASWGAISRIRFAVGVEKMPEDATTPPADAKAEFAKAATAWDRYIALDPKPVDVQVASRMATVFSPEYLNRPAEWADVLGIATVAAEEKAEREKTEVPPQTYLALLEAQYAAKRTRPAENTARRLREITPARDRELLDARIALAKDPKDADAAKVLQEASGGGTQPGGTVTLPDEGQ